VQGGQYGLFEKTIYSKEYLFCEKSLVAVEQCFINGEYFHDTTNPYVLGPYKRPEGPIKIPKTEPERYQKFGEVASFPSITLTRDLRRPWKEGYYALISFRYRNYEAYKTEDHYWFESFWQRQYKDELGKWYTSPDQDTDKTGESVYPGRKRMNEESYVEYEEKNVTKDGTPIAADKQSNTGGSFTKATYRQMPVPTN
jgi:hypothetical protein